MVQCNATHAYNVVNDMNHESLATRYLPAGCGALVTEYKIDGFRLDLSKGFTQNTHAAECYQ